MGFNAGRFLSTMGGGFMEMANRQDQAMQQAANRAFTLQLEQLRQGHDMKVQDRYDARDKQSSMDRAAEATADRKWRETQNALDRDLDRERIAATKANTEELRSSQKQNAYYTGAARVEKEYAARIKALSDPMELEMLKAQSKDASGIDEKTGEPNATPYTDRMNELQMLEGQKRATLEALRLDYGQGSEEEQQIWDEVAGGGSGAKRYGRFIATQQARNAGPPSFLADAKKGEPDEPTQNFVADPAQDAPQETPEVSPAADRKAKFSAETPEPDNKPWGGVGGVVKKAGQSLVTGAVDMVEAQTERSDKMRKSASELGGKAADVGEFIWSGSDGKKAKAALGRVQQSMLKGKPPSVSDAKAVVEAYSDEALQSVGLTKTQLQRIAQVEPEKESGGSDRLEKKLAAYKRMVGNVPEAQLVVMRENLKKLYADAGLQPPDLG